MSDDNLVFKVTIDLLGNAEKTWLARLYQYDPEDQSEATSVERAIFNELVLDAEKDIWEFSQSFGALEDCVTIEAEEKGDPQQAARYIHEFFRQMRPKGTDICILSYARFGGISSGGTYYICKEGVGECDETTQVEVAKLNLQRY